MKHRLSKMNLLLTKIVIHYRYSMSVYPIRGFKGEVLLIVLFAHETLFNLPFMYDLLIYTLY